MARTIAVDFHGVLTQYQGGTFDPNDAPTPGAIDWLALLVTSGYVVTIVSRLSQDLATRNHIRGWLWQNSAEAAGEDFADWLTAAVQIPAQPPRCHLRVDDRAFHFEGRFPTLDYIENFEPWHQATR